MTEFRLVIWLMKGGWRYVAGAAAVIAFAVLQYAVWSAGYETAQDKCEAAAKQAQIDKLTLELKTATALMESAQETVQTLQTKDKEAQGRAQRLQQEIDALRQGARSKETKGKSNALVDNRCDLTRRGVQFFTR